LRAVGQASNHTFGAWPARVQDNGMHAWRPCLLPSCLPASQTLGATPRAHPPAHPPTCVFSPCSRKAPMSRVPSSARPRAAEAVGEVWWRVAACGAGRAGRAGKQVLSGVPEAAHKQGGAADCNTEARCGRCHPPPAPARCLAPPGWRPGRCQRCCGQEGDRQAGVQRLGASSRRRLAASAAAAARAGVRTTAKPSPPHALVLGDNLRRQGPAQLRPPALPERRLAEAGG
jgi:hypothetical protein